MPAYFKVVYSYAIVYQVVSSKQSETFSPDATKLDFAIGGQFTEPVTRLNNSTGRVSIIPHSRMGSGKPIESIAFTTSHQ
jgi:hypothetical protein